MSYAPLAPGFPVCRPPQRTGSIAFGTWVAGALDPYRFSAPGDASLRVLESLVALEQCDVDLAPALMSWHGRPAGNERNG
jgi:hypothetical protein